MWVFQNITLHRETNSVELQAKIRLAFHFVELNNIQLFVIHGMHYLNLQVILKYKETNSKQQYIFMSKICQSPGHHAVVTLLIVPTM